MLQVEAASYKDPSGYVFYYQDQVYRYIAPEESSLIENLLEAEFFLELVKKRMVIGTRALKSEHNKNLRRETGLPAGGLLQHDRLDYLSYPYEWSLSMCADAALLTLDIQEVLLEHGYSLKDATPFNVQFVGSNPIFIDICSIQRCSQTGIWQAYNQFCQSWLYPLMLYQGGFYDFRLLYLSYLDGISLNNVFRLQGFSPFWRFGLAVDYLVPAMLTRSPKLRQSLKRRLPLREQPNSRTIQLITVKRCKKIIARLRKYRSSSDWTNYTESCNYTEDNTATKSEFIARLLRQEKIQTLLDIGCNIGSYSKLVARHGIQVVAMDSDMGSIERLYDSARRDRLPILPLCVDISNPSPAVGWENNERRSLLARLEGRFDCVMILALVHHLLIVNRVSLKSIAELENKLTGKFLITEFVGPSDCGFKDLMQYRSESYDYYTIEYFKNIHSKFFEILAEVSLDDPKSNMQRTLFLMRKKTF